MKITELTQRPPEIVEELITLWQQSVIITHTFLSKEEIDTIEPDARNALKTVQSLIITSDDNENPHTFTGIENRHLEMLFVAPKSMHQGIDKKLLKYEVDKYNVNKLTVNEQNTTASKFYTHFGFKPCNRAPLDEQSRPYPLLYMKLQ